MENNKTTQEIEQMKRKSDGSNIYPKTITEAVFDKESGIQLNEMIKSFNCIYLPQIQIPNVQDNLFGTRCLIPHKFRRPMMFVTRLDLNNKLVLEYFIGESIEDHTWGDSKYWQSLFEDGNGVIVKSIEKKGDTLTFEEQINQLWINKFDGSKEEAGQPLTYFKMVPNEGKNYFTLYGTKDPNSSSWDDAKWISDGYFLGEVTNLLKVWKYFNDMDSAMADINNIPDSGIIAIKNGENWDLYAKENNEYLRLGGVSVTIPAPITSSNFLNNKNNDEDAPTCKAVFDYVNTIDLISSENTIDIEKNDLVFDINVSNTILDRITSIENQLNNTSSSSYETSSVWSRFFDVDHPSANDCNTTDRHIYAIGLKSNASTGSNHWKICARFIIIGCNIHEKSKGQNYYLEFSIYCSNRAAGSEKGGIVIINNFKSEKNNQRVEDYLDVYFCEDGSYVIKLKKTESAGLWCACTHIGPSYSISKDSIQTPTGNIFNANGSPISDETFKNTFINKIERDLDNNLISVPIIYRKETIESHIILEESEMNNCTISKNDNLSYCSFKSNGTVTSIQNKNNKIYTFSGDYTGQSYNVKPNVNITINNSSYMAQIISNSIANGLLKLSFLVRDENGAVVKQQYNTERCTKLTFNIDILFKC